MSREVLDIRTSSRVSCSHCGQEARVACGTGLHLFTGCRSLVIGQKLEKDIFGKADNKET